MLSDVALADGAGQVGVAAVGADIAPTGQSGGAALSDTAAMGSAPPSGAAAPTGGLLGFFRQRSQAAQAQATPGAVDAPPQGDADVTASPAPDSATATVASVPAPAPKAPGGLLSGLFGGSGAGAGGGGAVSALSEVSPGEAVPFGTLARLCGVDVARLAAPVQEHQRYRLYDSAAGATGPRNWYITGFDDGCARQFTAALALFGSVETHESLRYGAAGKDLPMTATDAAYKDVKSRVCRVGRNDPCGRRLDRLDRTSVFITIYERFGGNGRWMNAFLHDGDVAATDIASN
ncbi:hypothetical protein [Roseivivax sp. CAU 1753]